MARDYSRGRKGFTKKWLFFPLVLLVLFLCHRPLILWGCKLALRTYLPTAQYDQIVWQGRHIVLQNFRLSDDSSTLQIERVAITPTLQDFCFCPHIRFVHPHITFTTLEDHAAPSFPLPFLYHHPLLCPQWEIEQGSIALPSERTFYYSLLPGHSPDEIGTLSIAYTTELLATPMFRGHLQKNQDLLQIYFEWQEEDLSRLLPLTALIAPEVKREWDTAEGAVDVVGQCIVDEALRLQRLEFSGSAHQIVLESGAMGLDIAAEECTGTFAYPSSEEGMFFWDRLFAAFVVKEGSCAVRKGLVAQPFSLRHVNGELQLEPLQEPQLVLHAVVEKGEQTLQVTALGKGSLQEDDTFWSVVECQCVSASGKEMQAVLSLCRHERQQDVVQLKVDQADAEHLDFFSLVPGHCVAGMVHGSVTWLFESGRCVKLSLDHCRAENVKWVFPERTISVVQAEGDAVLCQELGQWKWEEARLSWSGMDHASSEWHLSEVGAHLDIKQGVLQPSSVRGRWGAFAAEVHVSEPKEGGFAQFHVVGDALVVGGEVGLVGKAIQVDAVADWGDEKWTAGLCVEEGWNGTVVDVFERPVFSSRLTLCQEEHLQLQGRLDLFVAPGQPVQWQLATSHMAGDLKRFKLPIEGRFLSAEEGLIAAGTLGQEVVWCAQADVCDLVWEEMGLTQGKCHLLVDSGSRHCVLRDGTGQWQPPQGEAKTITLQEAVVSWEGAPTCAFQLSVEELLCCKAVAVRDAEQYWELSFEEGQSRWGTWPLSVSQCRLDPQGTLCAIDVQTVVDLDRVQLLRDLGILTLDVSPVRGNVDAHLQSEDLSHGFRFELQSRDLTVSGHSVGEWCASGRKTEHTWFFEKIQNGEWVWQASLLPKAEGWEVPYFKGHHKELYLKGSGEIALEKQQFSLHIDALHSDVMSLVPNTGIWDAPGVVTAHGVVHGDYAAGLSQLLLTTECSLAFEVPGPVPLSFQSTLPIHARFSAQEGFLCEDLHWRCVLSGHTETGLYGHAKRVEKPLDQELSLTGLTFSATPQLIHTLAEHKVVPQRLASIVPDGNLEAQGELTFTSAGPVYLGALRPGKYQIDGCALECALIQVRYQQQQLLIKAKTAIHEVPLYVSAQIDLSQQPFGVIRLFDAPHQEGLSVGFATQGDRMLWTSARGTCYGVTCALEKHPKRTLAGATVFTGTIALDGSALSPLLPPAWRAVIGRARLGTGYQWEGDLVLWDAHPQQFQLSGQLLGEEFEAYGFRWRHLEANLEANAERVYLSNLRVEDDAGTLGVQRIDVKKEADWQLYIPQLIAREVRPALFRPVDGTVPRLQSFTLKHLLFKEMRGNLSDLSSVEASGHAAFTNQWKQEQSFLDAPMELLKELGLDPAALTPVQGEVDLELRGDRCYLLSLKNAFSEGKRSEFYLAPTKELSYIDGAGCVQIDLKLRQDALLKLAQPFTLTVRGTLGHMQYGVRF